MAEKILKSFRKVQAFHPHWTGSLLLSQTDNEIRHEGFDSRGTYFIEGSHLQVFWERHDPESFKFVQEACYHESIAENIPELSSVRLLAGEGIPLKLIKLSLYVPNHPYEVVLRVGTSDAATFLQVFLNKEYDSPHLPEDANTIVDLGGNIGLGSVFFGLRYPKANILSVEPDRKNFDLLVENTRELGSRIQARQGAVWVRDGAINFHTEAENGRDLEAWGGQVSEAPGQTSQLTPCYALTTLLNEAQFETVDILKVDIEGAELELFSQEAEAWLHRVKLIIVETHDRFREGSEAAVRLALSKCFRELPPLGENLLFLHV